MNEISGKVLSYGRSDVATLSMRCACSAMVVLPARNVSRPGENRRNFLLDSVYNEQRKRSTVASQTISHRCMETVPKCGTHNLHDMNISLKLLL